VTLVVRIESHRGNKITILLNNAQIRRFMIDTNEAVRLLDISKEIEDAMSTTVRINKDQVLDIVVADLFAKLKTAKRSGLDSHANMLECVLLQYYLAPDELETLLDT